MSFDEITAETSTWPLQPIGPVNLWTLSAAWKRRFELETTKPAAQEKAFVPRPANALLQLALAHR